MLAYPTKAIGSCVVVRSGAWASLVVLALACSVAAQEETEQAVSERTETITETSAPAHKYFSLRYQEDWSEGGGEDFFAPTKNINLGGDLRLDLGGSVRLRMMAESNKLYGAGRTTQDTFLLQQYMVHANFRYRDLVRVFIEGIHAQVDERQTPALGVDENLYDIHQAFVDVRLLGSGTNLVVRAGRQEMLFGNHRLVSQAVWDNTRQKFDGFRFLWRDEVWDADVFYVRPVPVNRGESLERKWDEYEEDQHFFGLYTTYKGWENRTLDVYYLVLLDYRPAPNSAGLSSQLTLHTLGMRYQGQTGPWDYELESTFQLGHHSGDEIFAWMVALEGGYTFAECPMTPRLAVGFEWATGDHDPSDAQHNTYNTLFADAHAYLGYLDQIGRANILAPHVELSFKPCDPVTMAIAYYHFFLDQNDDALYDAGGAAVRRDTRGNSGSAVGGELDVTVAWEIDTHQSLLFGYSQLWPGSFIDQTGDNDGPHVIYLQYVLAF